MQAPYLDTSDIVYQAMQAPDVDEMVAAKDAEEEFRKVGSWLSRLDAYGIWRWSKTGEVVFKVGETAFTVAKNEWIVYVETSGKFVILTMHEFETLFGKQS